MAQSTEMTILPNSEEAEKGALSSMMQDPDKAIPVAYRLSSMLHFFIPAHQVIYNLLTELWSDGKRIGLIEFTQELRDRNLLSGVGGAGYVTDLYTFVPCADNLEYYLGILKEKFTLRELYKLGTDLSNRAYVESDADKLLSDAQNSVFQICSAENREESPEFTDLLTSALENLESKEGVGMGTGLVDLDKKTGGFRGGQFIVVAGGTGQGKTALGLNTIQHLAIEKGIPCGIISMEMTGEELAERFIAATSRVNLHNVVIKKATEDDYKKIFKATQDLREKPIHIKDDSDIDLGMIRAMARHMVMKHKIKFLLVDYVQLITSNSKENRARELALTSQALKQCAKELDIVVMALSQVNDDGNIFDSRAIGFDADKIIKISHGQDTSWMEVNKNRKGPTGLVKVVFIRDIAKFENAAR